MLTRRRALALAGAAAGALGVGSVRAQQPPAPPFGFDAVLKRARELAAQAYDPRAHELPEELRKLDFDTYRNIRFRPEKALLAPGGSQFRLLMYHPGFLFQRPVVINIVRDGIATPAPYSGSLFDYGGAKFEHPLPVDLGFAGFRLNYPINDPRNWDELISFLGASYFRVLGRKQVFGTSARGVAIGTGGPKGSEEFPEFREFWIEMPGPDALRATIYALLDGPSITGAFRFDVYPGEDTVVEVAATLVPRKPIAKLGLAPLTSMFFYGENQRRDLADYRPELHDADGLLLHTGAAEWIWRPLRDPTRDEVSCFLDKDPKGWGLIQRDRAFDHYQDLELGYESRPSCWIEPHENWGEGHVELFEFPTGDETNDNVVAYWVPKAPVEPGKEIAYSYSLRAMLSDAWLKPGGRVVNTYGAKAAALGAAQAPEPNTQRYLIDFAGGDLGYYLADPGKVSIVPWVSGGSVLRTFLAPNPNVKGFRAGVDVKGEPGQSIDVRVFLKAGGRTLTETWTFPFSPANG